jgi:sugar O-acyltransferase (sialic acid O-acetyltransferase NeuD family)
MTSTKVFLMKTKKLVIIGDSAFAEVAHEYFDADSEYQVVGFSVERTFMNSKDLNGLPVVEFENLERIFAPSDHYVYVATVYTQLNRLRTRLAAAAKAKGYKLASYISSKAFVWKNVELGEHCFIFEDNTIQPFAKIEDNVVLWSGNHVGHHSIIRKNCFVSSHVVISGFCDVGENSFLGVNCTLSNNIVLHGDNWIGPNVVVMRDIEKGLLLKAEQPNPAKISALRFFKIKEN